MRGRNRLQDVLLLVPDACADWFITTIFISSTGDRANLDPASVFL